MFCRKEVAFSATQFYSSQAEWTVMPNAHTQHTRPKPILLPECYRKSQAKAQTQTEVFWSCSIIKLIIKSFKIPEVSQYILTKCSNPQLSKHLSFSNVSTIAQFITGNQVPFWAALPESCNSCSTPQSYQNPSRKSHRPQSYITKMRGLSYTKKICPSSPDRINSKVLRSVSIPHKFILFS